MYHIPFPGDGNLRTSSVVSTFRVLLTIKKEKNKIAYAHILYAYIYTYMYAIDIYVCKHILTHKCMNEHIH